MCVCVCLSCVPPEPVSSCVSWCFVPGVFIDSYSSWFLDSLCLWVFSLRILNLTLGSFVASQLLGPAAQQPPPTCQQHVKWKFKQNISNSEITG